LFLQQPIFVEDLCDMMLSFIGNKKSYNQIFCSEGPEIIESKKYYEIIAGILGVGITSKELSINTYFSENPESALFLFHRIYDF
jgi:hypothetical protein